MSTSLAVAVIFLILAGVLVFTHAIGVRHERHHYGWYGAGFFIVAQIVLLLANVVP